MDLFGRYHNYELHPVKGIAGFENEAWEGADQVSAQLSGEIQRILKDKKRAIVCLDFYPGVDREEILKITGSLQPDRVFDMEEFARSETELDRELEEYLTEDRVFGVMCHRTMECFFDRGALERARRELAQVKEGVCVAVGVGAGLLARGDLYVYCNLTRWEIQLRYRAGMPNWHCNNQDAPVLSKYKRGFFVEWRIADRYKKARYEEFDYMLDSGERSNPRMISGKAFRAGLEKITREPFRMEPYFDPGVWGGHWMQENFGLDAGKENFAWSFDGVPEENSINLKFGKVTVKIPAIDAVLYRPRRLLGERVHARFGAEFPIRFDLLDTMGGGNLSLQVHPLTEYIQDHFGMHYTQDESYYLLDADEGEETYVYLGVKKDVDRESMARDLKLAQKGLSPFPAEKYVNRVPVQRHDHILIPAGTVHCSGRNTMVLEISATPYIFTFKLWDWGRVGLDGIPRPIHLEHGLQNIQWDRDTEWIYENLVRQEKTIFKRPGCKVERTGLHDREFIDTLRYSLTQPCTVEMDDSVHVMNLVEGSHVLIESMDDSFAPFELHYAETAIVPADVKRYRIVPQGEEIMLVVAFVRR